MTDILIPSSNLPLTNIFSLDIFAKCNGHAEYQCVDEEVLELQDVIKGVRESMAPLKLYKIAAPDT